MTDLAEFVPLIEYNIDFNKTLFQMEASAKTLKWGEPTVDTPEYRNIDVVIVAYCIYYDEVGFIVLHKSIAMGETLFLIAYSRPLNP
ncbi:hypothetical protein DPMN_057679 [Dreissena polymorpha]|uniref:Uncharacterized protein n=1 Tax=Dreissena polymorpha TaxID=45954 RepID=A0A9D4C0L1_DREPO|nr:hypothetical protein DPMN_057679 [Dreissena polymorpha]